MIVLFKYYYKFCVSFAFLILTMSQKILVQTTKSETHNIILDVIEDALNFLNKGNLYSPIFGDLTMIMIIVISMIMIIVILVKVFVIFIRDLADIYVTLSVPPSLHPSVRHKKIQIQNSQLWSLIETWGFTVLWIG